MTWAITKGQIHETLNLTQWGEHDWQEDTHKRILLNNWGVTELPLFIRKVRFLNSGVSSSLWWSPPPPRSINMNFYGASKGNPSAEGLAGVFRDHQGVILRWFAGFIRNKSNNVAEMEGLIWGSQIIIHKHMTPLVIKGDSKLVLTMAKRILNGQENSKVSCHWCLEFRLEKLRP